MSDEARGSDALSSLLREVREAPAYRRLEWRSRVEEHGSTAVEPLLEWIDDADLREFASFALDGLAAHGHEPEVLEGLRVAYRHADPGSRPTIERLGRRIATRANRPPPLPVDVKIWIGRINRARRIHNEPALSPKEIDELTAAGSVMSEDPTAYRNHCWTCHAPVLEGMHPRCTMCGWLECYCGACIAPWFGFCPRGETRFPEDFAMHRSTG